MYMKRFKKIYIEITNICNLKCSFCSIDNKEKKEMNKEEFEEVLKKINNYTDYLYLHVKGEPLIHSSFKDILKLCMKYNKKVNITTNGTLLKKRINIIINSSVRQVNISLHSMVEDKLEDILEASKILSKNKIYVVFRFWVYNNKENDYIKRILNFYNIDNYNPNSNIKINEFVYINKASKFIWPNLNNKIYKEKGNCLGLKTHIGILSDGTVIPCCLDSNGIIDLGNIFDSSLENILNSNKAVNILQGFKNNKLCEELCKKCGYKR